MEDVDFWWRMSNVLYAFIYVFVSLLPVNINVTEFSFDKMWSISIVQWSSFFD